MKKIRRQCKCGATSNLIPESGTIRVKGKRITHTVGFICRSCLFNAGGGLQPHPTQHPTSGAHRPNHKRRKHTP